MLEEDLWARLVDSLSKILPTPVLENWIRPCRMVAVEGDHLRIGAPNKFSRDWLAQNYLDPLHQAAREVLGGHPRITLIVDEVMPLADGAAAQQRLADAKQFGKIVLTV